MWLSSNWISIDGKALKINQRVDAILCIKAHWSAPRPGLSGIKAIAGDKVAIELSLAIS